MVIGGKLELGESLVAERRMSSDAITALLRALYEGLTSPDWLFGGQLRFDLGQKVMRC